MKKSTITNKILDLCGEIHKKDTMELLLSLCTDSQKDLFEKIYPNGPTDKQLDHAIFQCSNTLKHANDEIAQLESAKLKTETELNTAIAERDKYMSQLNNTNKEIQILEKQLEARNNLMSDVEKSSVYTQERLARLDALEAAGVDNWDGYDYAMEMLEEKCLTH